MRTVEDDETGAFYAAMAPVYELFFHDWTGAVVEQGRTLDRLIAMTIGAGPKRILDATCGVGTQAIGLALCGHDVLGTDISGPALARAAASARRLDAPLSTRQADLRSLASAVPERFDVTVVFDNSLAHLLSQAELCEALRQLAARLVPGGLLLVGIRDYDVLRVERPRFTSERIIDDRDERRVVFQVWDWVENGAHYDLTQYLVQHGAGGVDAHAMKCRVRALSRQDLVDACAAAALTDVVWHEPADTGFYQPILAARRK